MPVIVLDSRDIVENNNKVPAFSEFRVLLALVLLGIDLQSDTVRPPPAAPQCPLQHCSLRTGPEGSLAWEGKFFQQARP